MADKVQKILEEVVRLHNLLPVMDGDNISVNYADRICTALKMYIDSLQKESKKEAVIEVEKIMAEVDAKFPKFAEEVRDIHSCDPHFGVNIEEESANGDLDIAIGEYCSNPDNFITYIDVASGYRSEQKDDIPLIIKAIKFGANWKEQQMMAKAIEATCFGIQGAALFTFRLPAGSYIVGSEVKVIIVKSE